MKNNAVITKDLANRKLHIIRGFSAPVEKVWKAWTESALLDKWWAPKPCRAETKILNFENGGLWLYSMVGPNGERSYCRVDFDNIIPQQSFTNAVGFCDEEGNINDSFPRMYWLIEFNGTGIDTTVNVTISFDNEADLEKIIEMGFEAGFTMALGNLDELLEA